LVGYQSWDLNFLLPKVRASLCKDKVEGFLKGKPPYTLDQVNSEIFRLQEFEESLKALLAVNFIQLL
jgi:hypothetical protein